MITIKENMMRLFTGEMPEFLPRYRLMVNARPAILAGDRNPDMSGTDIFGVKFVNVPGTGPIQEPGFMLFDDIRKWRDYIKVPDFSDVDWEAMAKKVNDGWDPDQAHGVGTSMGFFQAMYNFMGFTDALIACAEEPDEILALMEYLTDFYVANAKNAVKYYNADYGTIGDDIAHARSPFVSLDMFRTLFRPFWQRYIDVFKELDMPVILHNCGNNDILIDDFVEMGINAWEPAEEVNDIIAIKKRHGRKLAICGAFRQNGIASYADSGEEEVKGEVSRVIEAYGPGGGYAFCGIILGAADDADINQRNQWILEECDRYANMGSKFYEDRPFN